jgi:hypothetical protein
MPQTQAQGWHVGSWGLWGWLETIIKFVGMLAAYAAFFTSSGDPVIGGNPELGAILITALVGLGYVGALAVRFQQREIISMAFAILNVLAHIAVILALLRNPSQTTLPLVFAIANIIGEIIKQVWLSQTGYTEMGQTRDGMMRFSRITMSIYILIAIALLI